MINIGTILITALALLIVYRTFLTVCYAILNNLIKSSNKKSNEFDIGISLMTYMTFLLGYLYAIPVIIDKINNLEWYVIYTLIGITSIVWCYFKWDVKSFKSKPKLIGNRENKIKKISIFLIVFLYTTYLGYNQTLEILEGKDLNPIFKLMNATAIAGIIALDRVLSLIYQLISDKK